MGLFLPGVGHMHGHRVCRYAVVALLACVLWLQGAISALADCPGNVAINAGFEEGFSERGAGEVTVANGWQPFWQDGPNQKEGYNRRPEYKGEDASRFGRRRVRSGNWSQKMFNTYATHHAGLWQQISVPAGSVVTLSAWGQAWSSEADDPAISKKGQYQMSVGIDPTGGTDFNSPNVVWSPRSSALDQWVELKVQARAQAGTVTLYLRGDAEWRMKHNDVYFDDVCVNVIRPTAPPPPPTKPPKPTDTPLPTATTTETPEPTATPSLTPSPTEPATLTPQPGAIRVIVFEDKDGDGLRDTGESPLARAKIELLNAERTRIASRTTDGSDGQVFADLNPGTYYVLESDPPGYASTNANEWAVVLAAGAQVDVLFADRLMPSATATPKPTTAPVSATETPTVVPQVEVDRSLGQRPGGLAGISGILVALVALALPITLRLFKTRL
ncbi:MAG: hypothetical protein H5T69_06425 [Chloroflexi bacterium]|nr:hypothetical protein [Chloroflexota bacterium]